MRWVALIDGAKGLRDATGDVSKYSNTISDYLQCSTWKSVPKKIDGNSRLYRGTNGEECLVYFKFTERAL